LLPVAAAKPDPAFPPDGMDLMPVLLSGSPIVDRTVFWRTQDMAAARTGDWKYVRSAGDELLANLAEDETENANFKLKQAAIFERLTRAYEAWDRQMLPIPREARRSPWQSIVDRARNLDPVRP
jgi:arylsulfatase A-like enzyme